MGEIRLTFVRRPSETTLRRRLDGLADGERRRQRGYEGISMDDTSTCCLDIRHGEPHNDDDTTCLEMASQARLRAGQTSGGVLMAVYRAMVSEGGEDVDWVVKNGGHVDGPRQLLGHWTS